MASTSISTSRPRAVPHTARRPAAHAVVPSVLADQITRRPATRQIRLLWHERIASTSGTTVLVKVPLLGHVDPDLPVRLSAHLHRQWVGRTGPGGETVTSVSAVTGRAGGGQLLVLFVSYDRIPDRHRVDDMRMARDLRRAIDACAPVPVTGAQPAEPG